MTMSALWILFLFGVAMPWMGKQGPGLTSAGLFAPLMPRIPSVPYGLPASSGDDDYPDPVGRTFGLLCSYFCNSSYIDYDYFDYYSLRLPTHPPGGRIFCGLCYEKYNTSTTKMSTEKFPQPTTPLSTVPNTKNPTIPVAPSSTSPAGPLPSPTQNPTPTGR